MPTVVRAGRSGCNALMTERRDLSPQHANEFHLCGDLDKHDRNEATNSARSKQFLKRRSNARFQRRFSSEPVAFMRLREIIEERASRKFFEEQAQADRPVVLRSNDFSS